MRQERSLKTLDTHFDPSSQCREEGTYREGERGIRKGNEGKRDNTYHFFNMENVFV